MAFFAHSPGRRIVIAASILAAAIVADFVAADDSGTEKVDVLLTLWATPVGGGTEARATVGGPISVGHPGNAMVGNSILKASNLVCGGVSGSGSGPSELEKRVADVWRVSYRMLPSDSGLSNVELTWEHLHAHTPGVLEHVAGDTHAVGLKEGEHHVLDYLGAGEPGVGECGYRNVYVAVTAKPVEDPALADAMLAYDLWWQHSDLDGSKRNSRFQATGRQGRKLDLSFSALPLSSGEGDARGVELNGFQASLLISGSIRGRVRPDGSVEVSLDARRDLHTDLAGKQAGSSSCGAGDKTISLRPGEPVSIVLPKPACRFIDDGQPGFSIDLAKLYADREDSLVLTVTRAR